MPTIGEKRVRPEHRELTEEEQAQIEQIKTKSAELIDLCESLKSKDPRLSSLAQTAYEQGALWAVKAVTV